MRPEPPARYRVSLLERTGVARWFSHSFRIAVRNLERKPMQAAFTVTGLALATGILMVPNAFRDSVSQVLDFQWDIVQRQDISVGLIEPAHISVAHELTRLPGVISIEPFRGAFVRLRNGHRHRQLALQGQVPAGLHSRIIDANYRQVVLPPDGVVLSVVLGQLLDVRLGDMLTVEVLEGRRATKLVPVIAFSEDLAGVSAFMDIRALNRLLGDGDVVSGASFRVDEMYRALFLRELKNVPRVAWVAIKSSLRDNFRRTTAASINTFQKIYLVLSVVVAFGVVYNNARISLAERARELATLRVVGFSQREVGAILITELVILALIAVPIGLVLGSGFATGIVQAVNTETIRLPVVLTASNYAFAVADVTVASVLSALSVLRKLNQLNLVGALKAPE
jgi:putative ABC transport system permease protein